MFVILDHTKTKKMKSLNNVMEHTHKVPTTKRSVQWYIKEIQKLEEIDKQTALKVQHQLNVIDQKEKRYDR